jgi:hypothetical protein
MPKSEMVFRGASAPIMEFIKNGKLPTHNETQPFIYKARSPIQSWSESRDVAEKFGEAEKFNEFSRYVSNFDELRLEMLIPKISNMRVPVILQYMATPEDFLFKGKYLNKLSEFGGEQEVIRVDNTPIKVEAYLNEKWLTYPSIKIINQINNLL